MNTTLQKGLSIMHEQTMEFSVQHDKEAELKKTLTIIYDAL